MKKNHLLIAAMALAFAIPGASYAGVSFDPDGAGAGSAPAIDVGAFDWGPASFAAVGGNNAAAAFVGSGGACPANSCNFDVLTQARMTATFNQSGTPNTPSGLNNTYEITMITRFSEVVTDVGVLGGNNIATFTTVAGQPTTFLQIFYDTSLNSNDLTGHGFNDGRLILTADDIVGGLNGQFSSSACGGAGQPACANLDGHLPTNNYTNQLTRTGAGSQGNLTASGIVTDPTFFLTALANMGLNFANISTGLPYISVDPADCYSQAASATGGVGTNTAGAQFCATTHVNGLMSANAPDANGGFVPTIGVVNGAFVGTNPDFVAQTDFNSPVTAAVPEPSSIALLGLGLAGLGFMTRRRNRT